MIDLVQKFGGTSLGTVDRIREVCSLVTDGKRKFVVLSAFSGRTSDLFRIATEVQKGRSSEGMSYTSKLRAHYLQTIDHLYEEASSRSKAKEFLDGILTSIEQKTKRSLTPAIEKHIVAQGEILSTHLFGLLLRERKEKYLTVYAPDFLEIDEHNRPNETHLQKALLKVVTENPDVLYFITQGFICLRSDTREIDNLERGGSDYTASLIGAALEVPKIEIWTDIDGLHNGDPRYITKTKAIDQISFEEASELAYFGAKVLHPKSVLPAQQKNIPILLKNTLSPKDLGTEISGKIPPKNSAKGIATKEGISMVKVLPKTPLDGALLKSIFEIFENYKTPIELITTSENSVSMSVDREEEMASIRKALNTLGKVSVENGLCVVSLVGNKIIHTGQVNKIFEIISKYPIRMLSYGSSENNISIIVPKDHQKPLLKTLHSMLYG